MSRPGEEQKGVVELYVLSQSSEQPVFLNYWAEWAVFGIIVGSHIVVAKAYLVKFVTGTFGTVISMLYQMCH